MVFIKFDETIINTDHIIKYGINFYGHYYVEFNRVDIITSRNPGEEFLKFYNNPNNFYNKNKFDELDIKIYKLENKMNELEEMVKCLPIFGEDYNKLDEIIKRYNELNKK